MDYLDKPDPQTFIAHHGIKGQKWGVRRFQNADGSLTKAGKERYNEQNSARGELSVTWKGHNGGHSLAWEVINNKPVIFDFQTHKVYETPDKFSEIANMFDGLSTATSCRLDDKDLNLDLLRRWVKHS